MSRLLFAAEHCATYGHTATLLSIADELHRRGHDPIFCVRNLSVAQAVLADRPFALLQAPSFLGFMTKTPGLGTFAETLWQRGCAGAR